ncbi:rhodanese-like domain-containing protein [Salinimicrobium sp. GXAS 041]|uniref:rhodanese-like domain-containing protein n=1 Tax=Salinimicrobium sp. GXAS 041 TaxID=3400806 RepID=UPI003C796DA3
MTLALIITGASLFAQHEGSIINLKPQEFKAEIQAAHVQLIDVRTPEEFDEGHIVGAKNVDYKSNDFLMEIDRLDRERPVYIYCRSGNRSSNAAKELYQMGFLKIYNLEGGYLSWQKKLKE